jgi:hypothetical protein
MNEQNFGELVKQPEQVEDLTQNQAQPGSLEQTPILATLIYQTPNNGSLPPGDQPGETLVQEAPQGQTILYNQAGMGETLAPEALNPEAELSLLSHAETEGFRTKWNEIQGQFVDEPQLAVNSADALVGEVIEKISALFAAEHTTLENQWKAGGDISTEDLRLTLQHYRAFFNRLLRQVPD